MTGLHIAPGFVLPIEFVTTTQAIIAKKRVGKSYKASVQAEEMLEARQQIIAIDPTSAWWGLRSSADGKHDGYPVVIFGGAHADLPLDPRAGVEIADAIIEQGFSAILDLSLLTKGEEQRLCAAFLDRLYRKNRRPLHLFLDEADVYAPQRPQDPDESKTLGACQSIVRRGGIRGIGCTMITQRPAVLNKDVLSQVDTLTVLRMNHPKDLDAIDAWVSVHGDPQRAKEMRASLPNLPKGDAWVWAPDVDIFERITYRDRRTFDSGRTPKLGEGKREPKVLAPIDIARLGQQLATIAQEAKENDPRELKKKIADLQAQLAKKLPAAPAAETKTKVVERHVMKDGQIRALSTLLDRGEKLVKESENIAQKISVHLQQTRIAIDKTREPVQAPGFSVVSPGLQHRAAQTVARVAPSAPRERKPLADGGMVKGERVILSAIIQHGSCTREQLTVLTGYTRSSRNTYLQKLGQRGYIAATNDGEVATAEGIAALPDVEALPTGDALRQHWLGQLPQGERVVLEVVIAGYPQPVDREQIDAATGYTRSSRNTYLQKLGARRLVINGRDGVRASELLFEAA